MTQLTHGTHVVIADSEKALYLVNHTDAENPYLQVVRKDSQDNPKDIDQSANRPGRMSDGASGPRSAFDDTDWHELAKDRFAQDIAERLYTMVHAGKIERLVLVAGPQVLGTIREALHKEVQDTIVAEIPKTLTNHPLTDIEKRLREELAD
jgi:protein required for attachment to host cells